MISNYRRVPQVRYAIVDHVNTIAFFNSDGPAPQK